MYLSLQREQALAELWGVDLAPSAVVPRPWYDWGIRKFLGPGPRSPNRPCLGLGDPWYPIVARRVRVNFWVSWLPGYCACPGVPGCSSSPKPVSASLSWRNRFDVEKSK